MSYVLLKKPQLSLRLFYASFSTEGAILRLCERNKGCISVFFVSIGVLCAVVTERNIFKKKAAKTAKVYPLVAANIV